MIPPIIGLETEYGGMMDGQILDPTNLLRFIRQEECRHQFTENGGRLYADVGDHIEFATPECRNPFEACLYDLAGDYFLSKLIARAKEEGSPTFCLYRNNMDYEGTASFGCHENYLIPQKLTHSLLADQLTPHLVSRIILTGTGKLYYPGYFEWSQRAPHIEEVLGDESLSRRPLIHRREESFGYEKLGFRRLHLICGESNVSQWANVMKLGTTMLVLAGIAWGVNFSDLLPKKPVAAIRLISHGWQKNPALKLKRGGSLRAHQIQDEIVARLKQNLQFSGLPRWTRWVVSEWQRALTDFAKDPLNLAGRSDAATKLYLFRLAEEDELPKEIEGINEGIDFDYHELGPDSIASTAMKAKLLLSFFSPKTIGRAVNRPPRSIMRAKKRGQAIKDPTVNWIDWGSLLRGEETEQLPFDVCRTG